MCMPCSAMFMASTALASSRAASTARSLKLEYIARRCLESCPSPPAHFRFLDPSKTVGPHSCAQPSMNGIHQFARSAFQARVPRAFQAAAAASAFALAAALSEAAVASSAALTALVGRGDAGWGDASWGVGEAVTEDFLAGAVCVGEAVGDALGETVGGASGEALGEAFGEAFGDAFGMAVGEAVGDAAAAGVPRCKVNSS